MRKQTENPLAALAGYIVSIKCGELPAKVKRAAAACTLDSLGAGIGGLDYEEVPEVVRTFLAYSGGYADTDKKACVWGSPEETSVFQAAFLNGTMSHALELDDVHTGSKTHIGAVCLPAIWAVAEAVNASGARVLEAVVAAYETMARVGRGFGVADHRLRGWHVSGTAGTFGAAAGAGKLLGLDAQKMVYALGMAGTQSSGLWAFLEDGATSKKMHTGCAAESGVVSAFLAEAGMTGPEHILDARDGGLYPATSGSYDLAEIARDLGVVFEILSVDRKPYSCCRSMHPALDAILAVRAEKWVDPSQITRISIRSYAVGVKQCGVIAYPVNVSESKFSMRFGVAVAYIDGAAAQKQFHPDRIADPAVRDLASRIDYVADPEFTGLYPGNWGCGMVVEFADGARIEKKILDPSGGVANPMTPEQMERKFTGLVSPFLGETRTRAVLDSLKNLETLPTVRGLLRR